MSVPEILLVLALGLAIGSFLNVVIYRLPRMLEGRATNLSANRLPIAPLAKRGSKFGTTSPC